MRGLGGGPGSGDAVHSGRGTASADGRAIADANDTRAQEREEVGRGGGHAGGAGEQGLVSSSGRRDPVVEKRSGGSGGVSSSSRDPGRGSTVGRSETKNEEAGGAGREEQTGGFRTSTQEGGLSTLVSGQTATTSTPSARRGPAPLPPGGPLRAGSAISTTVTKNPPVNQQQETPPNATRMHQHSRILRHGANRSAGSVNPSAASPSSSPRPTSSSSSSSAAGRGANLGPHTSVGPAAPRGAPPAPPLGDTISPGVASLCTSMNITRTYECGNCGTQDLLHVGGGD